MSPGQVDCRCGGNQGTIQTWEAESESHAPFSATLVNNLQYDDFSGNRFQVIEADATALPYPDSHGSLHANPRIALEFYQQAVADEKREAQELALKGLLGSSFASAPCSTQIED